MKKITPFFLIFGVAFMCLHADIAFAGPIDQVGAALQASSTNVMNTLTAIAFKVLFALSMIKFIMIGAKQIQAGDIEMSLGKYVMAMSWVGFIVWLMSPAANAVGAGLSNGANFIQLTVNYFLGVASKLVGGTPGNSFDAGDVMNIGLISSHNLLVGIASATVGSVGNVIATVVMPGTALLTALMAVVMNFIILVSCAYIALKIFMVKIEVALVIAITPLSFSLGGLDALRDHALAPFKNLLTIVFRIIVLAAIVSAMTIVSTNLTSALAETGQAGITDIWSTLLAAIFGYVLLAFLAHKSDAIAASLCSGSSMFSSSDVFGAAAMGAAMGAAVASGGAAAAGAATKTPESLPNLAAAGDKGTISNASSKGSGGGFGGSARNGDPGKMDTPKTSPAQSTCGQAATQLASLSGANPEVAAAAAEVAGTGGSAEQISEAVEKAGGTPAQAKAISHAAKTDVTDKKAYDDARFARETSGNSGSTSSIAGPNQERSPSAPQTQPPPYKKSALDHMSTVNDHLTKEQTTIHANLDGNAHDR